MGRKNKKNNNNDYWDTEFEEDAETNNSSAAVSEVEGDHDGTEAEPEAPANDFMANLKKAKNKQDAKKKKEEEEKKKKAANKPVIKSKKEKERERKEREKQKKKEAAAKRREARERAQKAAAEKKEAEKKAKAEVDASTKKEDSKEKKEDVKAEKKAAGKKKTVPAKKTKKTKKGKKIPAGLALLKKQMELRKKAEEEAKNAEEEEKKRLEEEEKMREEEEKAREEAKRLKKEKEKAKIAQLKKEGKYLTKKQKRERAIAAKRRDFLLKSKNIQVAGVAVEDGELMKVADSGKKNDEKEKEREKERKERETKQAEQKKQAEKEAAAKKAEEEKKAAEEASKNEVVDDWEKLAAGEEVADSWEDLLAGEETAEATKDSENTEENEEETEDIKSASHEPVVKEVEKTSKKGKGKKSSSPEPKSEPEKKELRSPICCILGHVDAGKTKLLDKIRQTNVQGGEAGGITQQIGATYFPVDALRKKTEVMQKFEKLTYDVPGLLVIDTPGHESFTNLRSRGSSLCNIAILVVDITHGLQQQTLESLRLLRDRKAPFVVALNKVDRLYNWKAIPNNSFRDSFTRQEASVQNEFENRFNEIKVQLAEQGLNSELYYKNSNMARYVSIVPTSATTGEGVPDLLWLLLELTQKRMNKQLRYLSGVQATILEVKVVEGLGTTIDVILSNGVLHEGDRIVLCGLNGPIATNIRALLTPPPSRELRIKSEYVHHKEVKAALGVKISADDLEKAVAGSRLLVVGPDDNEDEMKDLVMDDLTGLLDSVDPTGNGVVVQASTLGSLEALLSFLKDMKIPVMSIGLGPVYRKDVLKAVTMIKKAPEYAVMLCFDVRIDKEAEQYADEQNIRIFNSNIIYHLFDEFTAYQKELLEKKREENKDKAVFPCILKTIQIINKRNPMIIGVDVLDGVVKVGTPIGTVKVDPATNRRVKLVLGKVISMEINHEPRESVRKGESSAGVAVRLEGDSSQPIWGRHVDEHDPLYSMISRETIDTLKDPAFRSTVPREDWFLIKKLKGVLDIE